MIRPKKLNGWSRDHYHTPFKVVCLYTCYDCSLSKVEASIFTRYDDKKSNAKCVKRGVI